MHNNHYLSWMHEAWQSEKHNAAVAIEMTISQEEEQNPCPLDCIDGCPYTLFVEMNDEGGFRAPFYCCSYVLKTARCCQLYYKHLCHDCTLSPDFLQPCLTCKKLVCRESCVFHSCEACGAMEWEICKTESKWVSHTFHGKDCPRWSAKEVICDELFEKLQYAW